MNAPLYALHDVGKEFAAPGENLVIFNKICLTIAAGEAIAIVGASGSGKSTLLHLLGALDMPTQGRVLFEGQDMAGMTPEEKAALRNRSLGFVFQFHHLLPEFSALENVGMQAMIRGMPRAEAARLAGRALENVGLADKAGQQVTTLSGGERQRIAIARAILLEPKIILADEPTGNLDERTGYMIGDLLLRLRQELMITLVVVTHNRDLAARMDRCLELRSGVLYENACA
ncbi:MAG: ABC transporter ATP-binding protein [Deltaproteobacteria bacterium]|jgi:lipoprotein-releasing system ATP-binding protein|nr:ABC transporter ATP-binding protein [Deltaproteobacteria bacterium]